MSHHLQNRFKNINKNNFYNQVLFRTKSFAKIAGPVTFLLYDLKCLFFFKLRGYKTDFRIQNSIAKYHPVCPKNP